MSNQASPHSHGADGSSPGGFLSAFADIRRLPRAFWFIILAFVVETMAYFAVLTLMSEFLSHDLGWGDQWASSTVSIFTMLVTLFMLGAGSYAESFGLRRGLLAALLICVLGRFMFAAAPSLGSHAVVAALVLLALLVIALGEAIVQPVCYSGIKQYTDAKTNSMGYGLIYALMNGGLVIGGAISSYLRPGVQRILDFRAVAATRPTTEPDEATAAALGDRVLDGMAGFSGSGIQAVNWIGFGLSVLALLLMIVLFTRRAEAAKVRPDRAEEMRKADRRPWNARLVNYFTEGPFRNTRFIFFIFMLLPVRTLFAHQWLTMPQYILRAYPTNVADKMEWLVNWINPTVILLGVPIATALTRKVSVYRMMVVGSLVSALPTFLLCSGPNLWILITYFVLFSVGEALWSARFLEYASELAPEGRIAQYMGLANIPWLLAKGTTGFYSGYLLKVYCPAETPPELLRTETLWLIYGCIAMISPIGLWMARRWVEAGLHPKQTAAAAV